MTHTGCPEGEHEQREKLRLEDHLESRVVVTRQVEKNVRKETCPLQGFAQIE
jgi:hypothetical protein